MSSTPQTDSPKGLAYAVAAYGLWGFLPIYMKALAHLPAAEIIAHRIVWSLPIVAAVLLWQGRAAEVGQALRQPRQLFTTGALTADHRQQVENYHHAPVPQQGGTGQTRHPGELRTQALHHDLPRTGHRIHLYRHRVFGGAHQHHRQR